MLALRHVQFCMSIEQPNVSIPLGSGRIDIYQNRIETRSFLEEPWHAFVETVKARESIYSAMNLPFVNGKEERSRGGTPISPPKVWIGFHENYYYCGAEYE